MKRDFESLFPNFRGAFSDRCFIQNSLTVRLPKILERRSHRVSGPAARAHASASLREIDTQLASSLLIPRCRLACPSSRSCLLSSHFKLLFQESDSSSSNDFDFDHTDEYDLHSLPLADESTNKRYKPTICRRTFRRTLPTNFADAAADLAFLPWRPTTRHHF